ncbi:MAG: hypothetical protein HY364_02220 [Candidatus Aenigmarchaeota archaeon]|nr:hypothetical protein [Candidatus Aenigmarchaeota archaeon]
MNIDLKILVVAFFASVLGGMIFFLPIMLFDRIFGITALVAGIIPGIVIGYMWPLKHLKSEEKSLMVTSVIFGIVSVLTGYMLLFIKTFVDISGGFSLDYMIMFPEFMFIYITDSGIAGILDFVFMALGAYAAYGTARHVIMTRNKN